MKLLCSFTLIAALAGGSLSYAEPPAKAPPADKKPPPASADPGGARNEVSAADAELFLAFFNKFVDAIVANQDNCPKMAAALNGVMDVSQDVIRLANEAKAAGKKLPKAIEEKVMARGKTLGPALEKCAGDTSVHAALKRMDQRDAKTPPPKTDAKTPPAKK